MEQALHFMEAPAYFSVTMFRRPYNLLLLTAILVLIFSFLIAPEGALDFHLHDTYFVISNAHLFWAAAILLWVLYGLYLLLHRLLFSKILSWIHIAGCIAALAIVLFYIGGSNAAPGEYAHRSRRYYDGSKGLSLSSLNMLGSAIVAACFIQGLFLLNLLLGLFKIVRGQIDKR